MSPTRIAGPCPVTGCPNRAGSCATHKRQANREHNARYGSLYDGEHVRLRAQIQAEMDAGKVFTCWRCEALGRPHSIDTNTWDLGHENGAHRGPECVSGNRSAPRRGGG